jgi:hypothetical protein
MVENYKLYGKNKIETFGGNGTAGNYNVAVYAYISNGGG